MNIKIVKFEKRDVFSCLGIGTGALLLYYVLGAMWNFCWTVPRGADGDGFGMLALAKYMVSEKDWTHVDGIGAPFGVDVLSTTTWDSIVHWVIFWLIARLTHNVGYTVNVSYFLTYGLSAMCTFYMLRKLNVSRMNSCVGAIIYAFIPGHLLRDTPHYYVGSCFVMPLTVLGMVYFVNGEFCKEEYKSRKKLTFKEVLKSGSGRLWFGMLSMILVTLSTIYYGFFGMIIYTFLAAYVLFMSKQLRNIYYYCLIALAAIASVFVAYAPSYLLGSDMYSSGLTSRSYGDVEIYGLKLTNLVLPTTYHRVPALAQFKNFYMHNTPLLNESHTSALGAVMSVGLIVGLFMVMIPCQKKNEELQLYGRINLFMILTGMIGGLASFVGLITYAFRCYNRLSFWIGLFALLVTMRLLDRARERLLKKNTHSGVRQIVCYICAVTITLLAVLDQTPNFAVAIETQEAGRIAWQLDDDFVRAIENYEGENAQILELPLNGMVTVTEQEKYYALYLPYIHSISSCWSYGAVGSYGDWLNKLADSSVEEIVKFAAVIGYSGIAVYAEMFGTEQWDQLRMQLTGIIGEPDVVHASGKWYYYSLRTFTDNLEAHYTEQEWNVLRKLVAGISSASYEELRFLYTDEEWAVLQDMKESIPSAIYTGSSLAVTDGYVDPLSEKICVNINGTQYGPYISLEAGKYVVVYTGDELQDATVYCSLPCNTTELVHTNTEAIYVFDLPTAADMVEFKCDNHTEKVVTINKIICYKLKQ